MRGEKVPRIKPRKRTATKILLLALPLVAILIVLLLLLVPAFVSSEKGRRMILARINRAITGKADFADLSMGWFKGVKVAELSFHDEAGGISIEVERVSAKPSYGSILTGNFSLGRTVIDKPRVEVNLNESQGRQTGKTADQQSGSGAIRSAALPIRAIDLVLNDGSVKVTDQKSGTVELSQINSRINLRPPLQQSDFDLKMTVGRADRVAQIKAAGNVTTKAKKGWSLKDTSGDLTVEVKDLDLESLGPIFALAGVGVEAKGVVNGTAKGRIKDGRFENLTTGIKAKNLDVTADQLRGDRFQTAALDVTMKLSQGKETINVDALKIESDFASVAATGTVPTGLRSAGDFLEADSGCDLKGDFNCDLAVLAEQMPRTLGLREGTQVTSGRLIGKVETVTSIGGKQIRADAIVTGLEGIVEGKKAAMSESIVAEALISSDKAGITFDKLNVTSSFARVNCSGRLESLEYEANANLAKLQSELGQFINIGQYQMAGEFLSRGQVSVTENKVTASGTSTVTNLLLSSQQGQSASEPKANIDFAVAVDRKENLVALDSVSAVASFGQVSISNGVLPSNKKSSKPTLATVSAKKVDLEKLLPFGVMFGSLPKEMQLSGIADSTLSVASDGGVYRITTDSTRIDGLRLQHPNAEKPFEPNEVTLAFDTEFDSNTGGFNLKSLLLDSPLIRIVKSQFSLSVDGNTARLSGAAELDYDWSAVSAAAAPYLPPGLRLEGRRQDEIRFSSEYPAAQSDQLLSNLSARARMGFEKAGYKGLNFNKTDVEIQFDNGVLTIPPFTTTVNEGQFSFAGKADFKEKVPLFRTPKPMHVVKNIKINDEITSKLLKYVNPIFADAASVTGFANFDCEQLAIPLRSEAKNETVVIGTISMNRVRLQGSNLVGQILTTSGGDPRGTDMTIHPTKIDLQKGFLRYEDMKVDVGDNPVNFKGVIGLDKSLAMTATLPYTTRGRTARVGSQTEGRRITLPIKGSVDAPELDLGKLLDQQLKGLGEELLEKGLEELFK
ncbi:MAG: hypothetical protein JSW59_10485 [Phycisphaerales bacterium]|nr:MAG: hypothetical protein JSW59_10485 [Phycisphaerales bacterium]